MKAKLIENQFLMDDIETKNLFKEDTNAYRALCYRTDKRELIPAFFEDDESRLFLLVALGENFDNGYTWVYKGRTLENLIVERYGKGISTLEWGKMTDRVFYECDHKAIRFVLGNEYMNAICCKG